MVIYKSKPEPKSSEGGMSIAKPGSKEYKTFKLKSSRGGGSSSGKTEKQLIEKMRAGGRAYLSKQKEATKLISSLTARAKITQKAKDQGKAFTRVQMQRELRKHGTSTSGA